MKNSILVKFSLAFLIATSMIFTSCDDNDSDTEVNPHDDAFADVFVKKVKTPQGDKYGLVFYAGGEGLTNCKAIAPDGTEYQLAEFWKGAGNMRKHPANNEMQGSMPQMGNYEFTLTFDDGETKTITDVLSDVEIPTITGVNVTYDATTETVTASWNPIDNVDGYMIKLTDDQKNKNKPIFVNQMPNTMTSYSFNRATSANPGWMQQGVPVSGDTNYIMVVGVKYEEGIDGAARMQNKQCATAKPSMITW